MTFLEAAIEVLRQVGRPLHVRELTERSIRLNLLSHQGRAPEETMANRLAQEVKKGDRSPLLQKGPGVFGLRRYERPKAAAAPAPAKPKAPAPKREAESVAEGDPAAEGNDDDAKKRRRRRGGRGRKRAAGAGPEPTPAAIEAPEIGTAAEPGTPEEAIAAEQLAEEAAQAPEPVAAAPVPEPEVDLDALGPAEPARYPRMVDLPSEDVLSAEYADEIAGGEAFAAPIAGEVVDEQSADEDRPMLAEIKEDPRRDRRERRKERDRDKDSKRRKEEKPTAAPAPAAAPVVVPAPAPAAAPASAPAPAVSPPAAEGDLVDVALSLLRSLNDPRPVHARQLAAMALKRKLLTGDPEELWRAIRSALAGDARARQAQGLRIRARHQGGGLFTLTTARLEPQVRAAEEALAARWQELARATHAALRERAARLPLAALEQLARIYLGHAGVREVARVKRAGEAWYLAGIARRGARAVKLLIGVRAGGGDVGRHAIGELRAGVSAKHCDEGLLVAPGALSADGERELGAAGPPIVAFAGDIFAEELVARGVGVVSTHLPVAYLDIDLLAELGES